MEGMKAIAAHAKFWEESKYMSKFLAPEGKRSEFGSLATPEYNSQREYWGWCVYVAEFWGSFGLK